jgi:hypothetical protein
MRLRLSFWFRLLGVILLIPCGGCLPDVAWLPDSSGFIYTETDWPDLKNSATLKNNRFLPRPSQGELIHFDLATKTRSVIATTKTDTIRPALSPDGKRIAVADLSLGANRRLQVIVFDSQGKELHRSKSLPWGDGQEDQISKFPQLFWGSNGNKLLICANKQSGIYDLDTQQVVTLGAVVPAMYGTSPIRPDGKGFLIAREGRRISFIDWEGKQTAIDLPPDFVNDGVITTPHVSCWSRWEGNVAIATWKKGQLRIDTEKKTATLTEPGEAEWAWDGREIQEQYVFPGGKVRVVVLYKKSWRDFKDAGLPTVSVEWFGPDGQRRILVPETFHCALYPSPNKERVALRYFTEGPEADRDKAQSFIKVVDAKGDFVAEINSGR